MGTLKCSLSMLPFESLISIICCAKIDVGVGIIAGKPFFLQCNPMVCQLGAERQFHLMALAAGDEKSLFPG